MHSAAQSHAHDTATMQPRTGSRPGAGLFPISKAQVCPNSHTCTHMHTHASNQYILYCTSRIDAKGDQSLRGIQYAGCRLCVTSHPELCTAAKVHVSAWLPWTRQFYIALIDSRHPRSHQLPTFTRMFAMQILNRRMFSIV